MNRSGRRGFSSPAPSRILIRIIFKGCFFSQGFSSTMQSSPHKYFIPVAAGFAPATSTRSVKVPARGRFSRRASPSGRSSRPPAGPYDTSSGARSRQHHCQRNRPPQPGVSGDVRPDRISGGVSKSFSTSVWGDAFLTGLFPRRLQLIHGERFNLRGATLGGDFQRPVLRRNHDSHRHVKLTVVAKNIHGGAVHKHP